MRKTLGVAVFSGMLGVTLFGIFLTPVFFYVIAGFAETPLFAAPRMRLVGRLLVYLANTVTLFIPWLLMWTMGRIRRRRAVPLPQKQFVILEDGVTVNGSHTANDEKPARSASDGENKKPVAGAPG
jgi:hypothetical protein